MDAVLESIRIWLPVYGPWLVFALALLETSFVTGLVVPAGVAVSLATALAVEGELALPPILFGALAGGFLGDSIGFWVGDRAGHRFLEGDGRVARIAGDRQDRLNVFFGRHPLYSVSLARLISFVRTLMPMAAGMTDLSYRRFVRYEAIGLVGWLAIYVAIGVAAGESWKWAIGVTGTGGAIAFAVIGVGAYMVLRHRAGHRSGRSSGSEAA